MKISVVTPILNECPWVGFSIMAALPFVHEFIYALDEKSDDGTRELLHHVKDKYAHEKLVILDHPNFHPHDISAYNGSFNRCIGEMTGDAAWFLHPDMVVTQGAELKDGPLAWFTTVTSYAGDMSTVIAKGRADKWKNIHAKKFGLHYHGAYGSQNEDFYHSALTGKSYRHFGTQFSEYPYQVADSGIKIDHYCESKGYERRLEKMKLCLKTLGAPDNDIDHLAKQHPRVTLESTSDLFGSFKFQKRDTPIPEVFGKYKEEFAQFQREVVFA